MSHLISIFVVCVGILGAITVVVLLCHYNLWRLCKNPTWPRILMYHNTTPDELAGGMNIKPDTLKKQIKYLISKNYTFLKISDLSKFNSLKKHVVLTFDDGFASNYTHLFPVLKKYNVPATIYLTPNIQEIVALNLAQIKEMQESGLVEFGAHTMNHVNLTKVDDEVAINEITESKLSVEKLTDVACLAFAYPYGRYELRHTKMVKEAGFTTAVTTKKQIMSFKNSNPFALPRLSVGGLIDSVQFYLIITRGRFKL